MSYAAKTSVTIDKSQLEIKKTLAKYQASGFAYGELGDKSMIMFEMKGRRFRFILPMPVYMKTRNKKNYFLSKPQIEQESRRRWRCLGLAVKAKLECVESGITTLEQEFMAHIVLPNGKTVGEAIIPQIERSYQDGQMPPLLGYDG